MNWEERWQAERARLITALGWLAAGGDGDGGGHLGLIEQIMPLGVGGLPGRAAADLLAIGIATWPFPPEASTLAALGALGYMPLAEQPDAELMLFQRTDDGTRYLALELVLLFKSKNTGGRARPQDQRDFELVLLHLDAEPRAWLRWALVATDPQHPWLESLAGAIG